ncbi:hypothetical protein B0H13DRAFT_2132840 [Mycena leptocephala]|nr:hypothetical protein B0H13DRAFT_2132840 [Mycena leptocephala]
MLPPLLLLLHLLPIPRLPCTPKHSLPKELEDKEQTHSRHFHFHFLLDCHPTHPPLRLHPPHADPPRTRLRRARPRCRRCPPPSLTHLPR